MTINEIREFLEEELDGIETFIDDMHHFTDGEQFSVDDNVAKGLLKDMLKLFSEEQITIRTKAVAAARAAEVAAWPEPSDGPDDEVPF